MFFKNSIPSLSNFCSVVKDSEFIGYIKPRNLALIRKLESYYVLLKELWTNRPVDGQVNQNMYFHKNRNQFFFITIQFVFIYTHRLWCVSKKMLVQLIIIRKAFCLPVVIKSVHQWICCKHFICIKALLQNIPI